MSPAASRFGYPNPWLWFWWRGLVFALSFALGFSAFSMGVGVSDRPGVANADLMVKVYYSLGLFVFGGLDLGVPLGGPAIGRAMLWVAYFTSPAITAAAVIEAAVRVLRPERWALRRIRDHVVIGGGGELARLVLAELRAHDPRRRVVVVELSPDAPFLDEVQHVHDALVVIGDITSRAVLDEVRAERAHRILLLTGDDLANIEAAHRLAERGLAGRLVVHVSDLSLMHDVVAAAPPWREGLFNSHHLAAHAVVVELLLPHVDSTDALDEVVLGGFGRFGQSLLAELNGHAGERLRRVTVIDLDARRKLRAFREEVRLEPRCTVEAVDGDIRDPAVWEGLRADLPGRSIFVLGALDEAANLHVALWLRRAHPDGLVVVRTVRRSAFVTRMAGTHGFRAANVPDQIRARIRGDPAFGIA